MTQAKGESELDRQKIRGHGLYLTRDSMHNWSDSLNVADLTPKNTLIFSNQIISGPEMPAVDSASTPFDSQFINTNSNRSVTNTIWTMIKAKLTAKMDSGSQQIPGQCQPQRLSVRLFSCLEQSARHAWHECKLQHFNHTTQTQTVHMLHDYSDIPDMHQVEHIV